ncbi:MAG: TorF family putative porin [Gammaproteobacteria bacterium]|nr:TorF family putative porin [Gammaproteobacteria bacterium]MCB1923843.1 TorF family putative porin [Gammaproteobacteria bacterium]
MKLNKLAMAIGACTMLAGPAMAEISGNVALTSNYIFRGVSQNDNSWAIQGGFDYAHDSGLYAGVWASNVDDNFFSGSSIEIDTYLGWSGDVGPVSLDVGYLHYFYPDSHPAAGPGNDPDTDEFHVGVSKDFGFMSAGFTAYYSPDFFDFGKGQYYDLSIDVPVSSFTISGHYGVTRISEKTGLADADYEDYSLGVSTSYSGLDFAVTYSDTSSDVTGALVDDLWAFTVSKSL